ncbi:hypothetical protein EDD11_010218 [Mortierella claussenii]|nr:hypothetical protein EDD11_010218 [Mortierella claussenii]
MTASDKEPIGPAEHQGLQSLVPPSQAEPSQLMIDRNNASLSVADLQHPPLIPPPGPSAMQPEDAATKRTGPGLDRTSAADYRSKHIQAADGEQIEEFYDDETSSETDLQHSAIVAWTEASGNTSDVVMQSSDDGGDDMDDTRDDDEDDIEEGDDDNFSDDTGDTDDFQEPQSKNDYHYHRPLHHGPYLKSRQQLEQLRKNQGRSKTLRKNRTRLRTVSGAASHPSSVTNSGAPLKMADAASETVPSQEVFEQTCQDVTQMLHQGPVQQGLELAHRWIQYAIEWRKSGNWASDSRLNVEQLQLLESSFFGAWAKELLVRRLPSREISHFEDYSSEYAPEDDEVPQLQLDFQRRFFSLGGLEICIGAIEAHMDSAEQPETKLRNLLLLLGLVSRIPVAGDSERSQFSRLSEYSRRLIVAVLGYFPDHADSFRSVSKGTVLEVISTVGTFLLENYRLQAQQAYAEQEPDADYRDFDIHDPLVRSNLGEVKFADLRLEMAVRLMKTSRLDLRLAGLVELKDVLLRIQRPQQGRPRLRRRSEADLDMRMDLDGKPIEHLCSKLQSMQIVGCIFGSNIHLEIVQRSTEVLVFLAQARLLTMNDLDLIWAAAGGNQHRSIVYGVYQVLGELCNKLPHDFLRNLFNKLQAVQLASWDQQLLDLSRSLFNAMVQRARSNPEEGPISLIPYETLLNVLRNSTPPLNAKDDSSLANPPSNKDVIGGIAYLLKDGLGVGPLPEDRVKLIDCCIKDLNSNHPGAIWSLQVVQHLFESHFPNGENAGLIFYERTCSSLPELYMANLKAYTSALKAIPPLPSPTISALAPLSTHYASQELWRGLQLKMRLDFLKAMARIYPIQWNSSDLAETLWKCLIVDPIGTQEQDEAFICLEGMTEPHFMEYIYDTLLPGLEMAAVTPTAWQCVQRYFLLLNWNKQKLIAAHPRQPETAVPKDVHEFRELLVATCVEHLVQSSDSLSNADIMDVSDVSLVFERCIGILKAFLVACSAESGENTSVPEIHGTLDEDAMLTVRVSASTSFQVSAHPFGTLSSLRRAIANRLECTPQEEVRLFSLGKDFSVAWDSRTLEELQVENGQSFLATKRMKPPALTCAPESEKRLPTDLLLMPEFFERVRQIFLLDEKYASQAWEIVTRLPTSPVLLQSLEELSDDVDWASLLDSRSPFLLLYSLQIINSLIKHDQALQDCPKRKWIKRFLDLGGQKYLTTLLMSESGLGAAHSSSTARKALALMLKVLVRLTNSSEIDSIMAPKRIGVTVPVFLDKLVSEILTSASREGGHSLNDQSIVLNATNLISHLCTGPHGWQYFHNGPDVCSLIFVSMVQSDSMQIRETVLEMGKKFCYEVKDVESSSEVPVMFFLNILQSFLPIAKEYQGKCSELFEFFVVVAREARHHCSEEYYKALYAKLMETIMRHSSSEDISMSKEDTVLIGMLRVATAMISAEPKLKEQDVDHAIIDYIFDECLFPQTTSPETLEEPVMPTLAKCQSEGSRSAAFGYLEEAAKGGPEILRHIIVKTRKQFDRGSDLEHQWGYDPQLTKKASCGFVGLQNLGATCYVNSLMQQFYMNREFRHGILDAPVSDADPAKHDTLLYQLQALFGNLQESIRRAYNAHGFCYSYKDWDGNPMNVAVQMDVDEFFSILFDRLENSVKSTPQEELFKRQYGGKLVQQIKSKDCEHVSEREDSFFSIQCEVKNKKTLEESLQLYVQGEILDGDNKYKCSSCDKHVDAIKRACIKELPQNLILHLKRFDYDMDTMRRIKINDRFEFPTRLDMEPYTLDYLTRNEQAQEGGSGSPSTHLAGAQGSTAAFQYNLVGVLVHTGTADSGHYYSYIKDRKRDISPETSAGSMRGEDAQWYLFNDSKVEEFDPSDIGAKAFGGTDFMPLDSSPYHKSPSRSTTKPYSAYMLFYERAECQESEYMNAPSALVPADIKDGVVKDNIALLKDLAVFDRLYYRFIWELFNLYRTSGQPVEHGGNEDLKKEPLDCLSLQYGLDFFFYVLIHARDVDQELQQWTRFLASLLGLYPGRCSTFLRNLAGNQTLLANVLLFCPITQVREAVIDLICEALHSLRERDRGEYGLMATVTYEAPDPNDEASEGADVWLCAHGSPIHSLIRSLLQILPEARANWRNFDEYFKLIYNITQLGRAERALMVREGYVSELVELYVSDEKTDAKKKKMGDKFTKPSFRYLLLTVQELVATCDVIQSYEALERRGQEHSPVHGSSGSHIYRKSSTSSSSTSSAISSSNSEEAAEDDVQIPSVSSEADQAVLLSRADLNALFSCPPTSGGVERSLLLLSKMIQNHIDSTIVARIVARLSSHRVLGSRLLGSLSSSLHFANEDQFTTIIQIFKELVQSVDDLLESRVEIILVQLVKILEQSPQPSVAYDCLDFFHTIADYGQCGRLAQAWLLRNNRVWLQELLLAQGDPETRQRARNFYMELLSSERAFNGWNDEEAAEARTRHFEELLQLMGVIPELIAYYPAHARRDDEHGGWKLVEYFKALTELVQSDAERLKFNHSWKVFIDILTKIDSYQLNQDYDKKAMVIFWSTITMENQEVNIRLANFKPLGVLLRKFFVCLQNNPSNIQFHREVLPIYFGLVLRFCKLVPHFHTEWMQCHNYTWALGAMKWGAFNQHCPQELDQLLEYTLLQEPQYRGDCWRMLNMPEPPRFHIRFMQIARATFEPENQMAGAHFFQNKGLVHLTDAMDLADKAGTATNEEEFFAIEALTLLSDYLCQIDVYRDLTIFDEAMDHWSNIDTAIQLLTGNLMWTTPRDVYVHSIKILKVIATEATDTQVAPILTILNKAHCALRNSIEAGSMSQGEVQSIFGGTNSPFCQYGALESRQTLSNARSPPMRIGPLIVMHPVLFGSLEVAAAQHILEEWLIPYWELVRSACKLDEDGEYRRKSIELASLMAMEQLDVGVLMHLDLLSEAAMAANNDDKRMSLHNPYVALLMERLLKRDKYLDALTQTSRLRACAALLRASDLDSTLLTDVADESFARIQLALDRTVSNSLEKDHQDLVTALQNITILGIDAQDTDNPFSARLRDAQEKLHSALPDFPVHYQSLLSSFLPSSPLTRTSMKSTNATAPTELASTTLEEEPSDAQATMDSQVETTMMTGIIRQVPDVEGHTSMDTETTVTARKEANPENDK